MCEADEQRVRSRNKERSRLIVRRPDPRRSERRIANAVAEGAADGIAPRVRSAEEEMARRRRFHSRELMEAIARKGTLRGVEGIPEDVRRVLVTDWDIAPEWHVRMQAVFQRYSDNSVSKTVNLPADSTPEDVRRIYTLAHELKCKGITICRYGSRKRQVLTLAGQVPEEEKAEPAPYLTAASEYAGGCPLTGSCPL